MFFHNWRQKRKLKKFRPIAILSTDAFYRHGFHPVLLRPKTVLKEIKTSVIRKEEHTHHIHHNMTMHVHQAQTFLQLQQQSNSSSLVIQSKRIINRSYPGSILQLSLARISVKQMAEQRLLEEKNYYQYHPAKARELVTGYLQHTETKSYLNAYMQKHLSIYPQGVQLHKSSLFTSVSLQTWRQVLHPVVQKQSRKLLYRERQRLQNKVIPKENEAEKKAETKQQIMPGSQSIDMNALIRAVVREVERKLKQERLREGRR